MLSLRKIDFLKWLRRYHYLLTAQLRDLVIPGDKDCGTTREILRDLRKYSLARKAQAEVVDPAHSSTAPVWTITIKGSCVLAEATGDVTQLLTVEPNFRNWQLLNHYTL